MKILIVTQQSFLASQTGVGTQVRETVSALRRHGVSVSVIQMAGKFFLREDGTTLTNSEILQLSESHDITHLINTSRPLVARWRKFKRSPVVGCSVYWSGIERVIIAHRAEPLSFGRIHHELSYIRGMCALGNDMRGVDVFLPNSYAEGECITRSYRMTRGAYFIPVPNAFIPPDFDIFSLPRPSFIPDGEYIVVPAVFAKRKNQLGLIRALKNSTYTIVFMGGEIDKAYWERCRREATSNMLFIGYKANGSKDYWSVLSHARCACLPSDCETPGIAMIEAAYAGARPAITKFGGTAEYYSFDAEYFNPCDENQMRAAIDRAWLRNRLSLEQSNSYKRFTWDYCAKVTMQAYAILLANRRSTRFNGAEV